jgi:CRP-like cAMP-binding protein
MLQILTKHGFTTDEIEDLRSNALVVKCPKKTKLLHEGEVQRFFYWGIKGIYRAGFTDPKGVEHTRNFYSPDSIPFVISYSSFTMQYPSHSFLESIEEGELLSWHYDYVQKLIDTDIRWLKFFKFQIDRAFAFLEHKDYQSHAFTPEERYSAFYKTAPKFIHTIPQHYVASYLGLSPEALSRVKRKLQVNENKES